MNVESNRRGEVLGVRLPGRVRPVERRAGERRHEERTNKFRGSAYGVFRDSDWYSTSQTAKLNGDPKPIVSEKDLGTRSVARSQAGRRQQACFSSTRTSSCPGPWAATRSATASQRLWSGAGDFSQTLDNNGNLYPYIKDSADQRHLLGDEPDGLLQVRGCPRRIDPARLYQTGVNLLKMYPMPNVNGGTYNYEVQRPNTA